METDPAKTQLLEEVLADTAPPAFRTEMLRLTLEQVHHRNYRRRRNRALLAAACMLGFLAAARFLSPSHVSRPRTEDSLIVHSRPLDARMLVTTQPGGPPLVRSSASAVAWVATAPGERTVEVIGDTQLFALLGGRPAALVRRGPAGTELVLLHPADQDGFPVH
jgi:hypothetical protein